MLWWLTLLGCSENAVKSLDTVGVPVETGQPAEDTGAAEPVADAGPDIDATPLQTITLDASASTDPNGLAIVAVAWSLVELPAASATTLPVTDVTRPTLFADAAGDYAIDLTVQNEAGVWDSTPDRVLVHAIPLDGLYVELSWNQPVDLDLHLMDERAELFGAGDCSWCNLTPEWGEPGSSDDPSIDIDDLDGNGPEVISVDAPSSYSLTIAVHYYDGYDDTPDTRAVVNVYMSGALVASYASTLEEQYDLWTVARVDWPAGTTTTLDVHSSDDRLQCED